MTNVAKQTAAEKSSEQKAGNFTNFCGFSYLFIPHNISKDIDIFEISYMSNPRNVGISRFLLFAHIAVSVSHALDQTKNDRDMKFGTHTLLYHI